MNLRRPTEPTFLGELSDPVLVRCPQCAAGTTLRRLDVPGRSGYAVACGRCGYSKDWLLERDRSYPVPSGGPQLAGFGLDLLLQTPCCGETLWVYNEAHLDHLREFVGATQRKRRRNSDTGWANGSLESRLPGWIKAARNREAVLAALESLSAKAAAETR
jgi:hypothetical protein